MNTRLQQFLGAENISQSQFADELGVARASVSHIIAGRNKPGFDFLTSLMARYPRLNMEWLLAGKGKMYKDTETSAPSLEETVQQESENLFSNPVQPAPAEQSPEPALQQPVQAPQLPDSQRKISKIIVFYDDNSFAEIS
ncbi:MAG: helix-turn-helix domain-containing protein [Bacteroidales bacterium]|nr:helix-turn-helix domain-containing protein [Bacteroidales bacterium]